MYPDDTHKPPVGQGLNKPARVTLEQSWPVCKTTHQPITDPERLEKMNYVEKLRRSTAKIGGIFVDYDNETGTCVFEVGTPKLKMIYSTSSASSVALRVTEASIFNIHTCNTS